MSKQPEQLLEEQLIENLQKLGYQFVSIGNEKGLLANLKAQLEKHNQISLSDTEFDKVLNILNKGSIFEKAKTLRQKQHLIRDNGDNLYFELLNTEHWCQNQYQVSNQIRHEGKYNARYDVTLFINGLPLVHIELKRSGVELKEAFVQIKNYQRNSFGSNLALYQYVQLFVISNGVNTKYYANNREQSFEQTFYWSDLNNKRLSNILNGFADTFLEPCHLSKMICKYIVLNESEKMLMVLRPYQFYAVEALIERVKSAGLATQPKNGYIWHTTGSGKTLTSFKASQILMSLPEVHKVVFVVDRKDLDQQTIREFNYFSESSIDGTDNTGNLIKQFTDTYRDKKGQAKNSKLIVTTIQKLNTAISKFKYEQDITHLKDKRVIFIFDECHRSQFGETHARIKAYFSDAQMFGFTGTPIFATNAVQAAAGATLKGKRTTKDLFNDCLHKYVITDAIRDENVLKFSIEYVGRYWKKDSATEIDIEVEDINTRELMEDEGRLSKIADYIIQNHDRKTSSKEFSAIFCVDSIESLIKYYEIFKRKKLAGQHKLNIATIFSYGDNGNADDYENTAYNPNNEDWLSAAEPPNEYGTTAEMISKREKLDEFIADYNQLYHTNFSTRTSKDYYNYAGDISTKLKNRTHKPENPADRIDILLVVNMFLTGFDAKKVNTIYIDKNLQHHGLIQTYSRTNRIYSSNKSQGNVVCFRNLKLQTDEAITLFSDKEALEEVIMKPYEEYVLQFNETYENLLSITPNPQAVNDLLSEDDELLFVKAFRAVMRVKNVIVSFAAFNWEDLKMSEQLFDDFKSKYLDLSDKVKNNHRKEKISVLDEVNFELELLHRDEINVGYIIQLLIKLRSYSQEEEKAEAKKSISNLLNGEVQLRSKKELIEQFIIENLPYIGLDADVKDVFSSYWSEQQQLAFDKLVEEENLSTERTDNLIKDYLFSEKEPLTSDILELIKGEKPSVLQRKPTSERILKRVLDFVDTFMTGMNL